jgi:hypothetical protein
VNTYCIWQILGAEQLWNVRLRVHIVKDALYILGNLGLFGSPTVFVTIGDPPLERLDTELEEGVSDRSVGVLITG